MDIDVPERVLEYFNWESPSEYGTHIDLYEHESVERTGYSGYMIDISKLPKNVQKIHVSISY